jgi:hypothetical protein
LIKYNGATLLTLVALNIMFSAWPIGISLVLIFTLFHYCDRDKQDRTRKTAIFGTVVSVYCLLAGLGMVQDWGGIFSDAPSQTLGRAAAVHGGKGAVILLLIEFWPYVLIGSGALGIWMYWMTILRCWPLPLIKSALLKPAGGVEVNDELASFCNEVINRYGYVIQANADLDLLYNEESALPYEKKTIKAAIKYGLQTTSDAAQKEILKASYLMLADFQHGGRALALATSGISSGNLEKILRSAAALEHMKELQDKINLQREQLLRELQTIA